MDKSYRENAGENNYTPFTRELENNKKCIRMGWVGYIIRKTILFTILIAEQQQQHKVN